MALGGKLGDLLGAAKEKVSEAGKKMSEAGKDLSGKLKQYNEASKEAKAPIEGAIIRYGVIYLGGLVQYPQKQSSEIGLNIMPDSFYLKPTHSATWFEDLVIPYDKVQKFEVVRRQVTGMEIMLSDGDTRSLEQDNNIEITYLTEEGDEVVLRLEMLTGITVSGQAGKCREMLDILRRNKILKQLNKESTANAPTAAPASVDIVEQIQKLKGLLDAGILTEDEFNTKKTELLAKM